MMQSEDLESEEEYDRGKSKDEKRTRDSHEFTDDSRTASVESDFDALDFGSTASLASSASGSYANIPKEKYISNVRTNRLDPQLYRKHRERNISLRQNLNEKFLKPIIATNIRKMDRLSQNISNYQISMQDALFQSRIATSNLYELQKQLGKFSDANYLREIRTCDPIQSFVEMDESSENGTVPSIPL